MGPTCLWGSSSHDQHHPLPGREGGRSGGGDISSTTGGQHVCHPAGGEHVHLAYRGHGAGENGSCGAVFATPACFISDNGGGRMTWVRENPQYVREGETRRFAVVWEGAASVSSGVDEVFANGSSYGNLTGSVSVTGNVMTTRRLTVPAGAGWLTLVWEVGAAVDGDDCKTAIQLEVLRPGQES